MPRKPVTEEVLDHRVMLTSDSPDLPATARFFEELAADPHPRDEVPVAQLLVVAGDFWELADRPDLALPLYRRAVADGGACRPDARCHLLSGLLATGLTDEAEQVRRELRAARLTDLASYNDVGETYERHGNLAEATRWFTAGLVLAERSEDPDADVFYDQLLLARATVREAQGFPRDEDDLASEVIVEERLAAMGYDDF